METKTKGITAEAAKEALLTEVPILWHGRGRRYRVQVH